MEIEPTRPVQYERVIDLLLRRTRSLTAALVSTVVVDASASEHRVQLVALEGGRLVGAGMLFRPLAAPPGLSFGNIAVEETAERAGTGAALLAALDARRDPQTAFTIAQVDADDHRSVGVAGHWGFTRTEVSVTSRLRLDDPPRPVPPPDVGVDLSPGLEFGDEDAVETMLDVSQTNPERDHAGPLTLAATGATTCVTNNADDNAGIRHVNALLGYHRTDVALFVRRELDQSPMVSPAVATV